MVLTASTGPGGRCSVLLKNENQHCQKAGGQKEALSALNSFFVSWSSDSSWGPVLVILLYIELNVFWAAPGLKAEEIFAAVWVIS